MFCKSRSQWGTPLSDKYCPHLSRDFRSRWLVQWRCHFQRWTIWPPDQWMANGSVNEQKAMWSWGQCSRRPALRSRRPWWILLSQQRRKVSKGDWRLEIFFPTIQIVSFGRLIRKQMWLWQPRHFAWRASPLWSDRHLFTPSVSPGTPPFPSHATADPPSSSQFLDTLPSPAPVTAGVRAVLSCLDNDAYRVPFFM